MIRPPDLLISADGRLIALRTPAGVFAQETSGASDFNLSEWRQFWASGPLEPIPWSGAAGHGAISCGRIAACTLRPRPDAAAALLIRDGGKSPDCNATILVSAEPAGRVARACRASTASRCGARVPSLPGSARTGSEHCRTAARAATGRGYPAGVPAPPRAADGADLTVAVRRLNQVRDETGAMHDTDSLHATGNLPEQNEISAPDHEIAQIGRQIRPGRSHGRVLRQKAEGLVDTIKKLVSGPWVICRDELPELDEVVFGTGRT
jgi:hypothetical protein